MQNEGLKLYLQNGPVFLSVHNMGFVTGPQSNLNISSI